MNDKPNAGTNNSRFQEPGSVSVNQRGSIDNDLGKKLIFIAVILAILVVGSVYAFNQWRATSRAEAASAAELAAKQGEIKPANVSSKRIFDDYIKPPPVVVKNDCKEISVLDKNGKPIIGKDGLEIKIGCDGKVPAIDFNAPPSTVVTIPKASRYGGDVLMPLATASEGATTLSIRQLAHSTNPNANDSLANQRGNIGSLITATPTPKVTAAKLGDQNLVLPKGRQIDCALSTKLITEVSGFASCVLTNNIYSDNGKVLLLERGSDAQGEYVASMENGQRRLFVLWTRVKTPSGILISLDSPAADGLGTMGLSGYVDNRWWDRLGAAFLLSFIKDAVSYQIAKDSAAGGAIVYQDTSRTGTQMADRVLANTINIKPTIYKNQGDRASIYVARDLDFSTVYALRAN